MTDSIIPLVICGSTGAVIDVAMMNTKGYRKSIETKTLWVMHPQTSRLLPWKESAVLRTLSDKGHWYLAQTQEKEEKNEIGPGSAMAEKEVPKPEDIQGFGDSVLATLVKTIRQRRLSMPEGSYTTHLFSSGPEKIRKKTGEEAIELILAKEKNEIVYEAADLVYHLLVMLESENIPFPAVLEELRGRF